MQLTSNIAILATVFAFSAPVVLSLPISGDFESITARETDFDVNARNFDDLKLTARELIERYYEARDFLDTLDARSAELPNHLAARAGTTPTTGTNTNTGNTNAPQPAAGAQQPITDQDFQTINAKIKASVTKIIADSSKHPALAEIKGQFQAEISNPASVFIYDKVGSYFSPGRALKTCRRREARLEKILANINDPTTLGTEILAEKDYLQRRHDRYTINTNLDPILKDAMVPTHPSFALHSLLRFAVVKNQILNLLTRMAADKSHPYNAQAAQHLANKAKHREAIKNHSNPADDKESKDWKAHIEQIKKGENRELVYAAENQARRLEVIAKGNTGANAAAYKEAFAEEQQANSNSGVIPGQNPAPKPPTAQNSQGSPQAKLRRRRF